MLFFTQVRKRKPDAQKYEVNLSDGHFEHKVNATVVTKFVGVVAEGRSVATREVTQKSDNRRTDHKEPNPN